jgi:hypothetical protein
MIQSTQLSGHPSQTIRAKKEHTPKVALNIPPERLKQEKLKQEREAFVPFQDMKAPPEQLYIAVSDKRIGNVKTSNDLPPHTGVVTLSKPTPYDELASKVKAISEKPTALYFGVNEKKLAYDPTIVGTLPKGTPLVSVLQLTNSKDLEHKLTDLRLQQRIALNHKDELYRIKQTAQARRIATDFKNQEKDNPISNPQPEQPAPKKEFVLWNPLTWF